MWNRPHRGIIMKLFGLAFATVALFALPSGARAQSLAENATAAGITLELARRATSNGTSTLNRAKKNLSGQATANRDPFAPNSNLGQPSPGGYVPDGSLPAGYGKTSLGQSPGIAAPPPPPPPAPWLWRLKGFVSQGRILMAVWQTPDGIWRSVKVGEKIDDRSKIISIGAQRVVVLVDGKKMGFSPW